MGSEVFYVRIREHMSCMTKMTTSVGKNDIFFLLILFVKFLFKFNVNYFL